MKFLNTGLFIASLMLTTNIMAQQKIKQTAGATSLAISPQNLPVSTTTYSLGKCGAAMTSFP